MSRDYTKEIGNRSSSPRVPLPIALVVLGLGGAALWFAVAKIHGNAPVRHSAEAAAPAVAGKPAAQTHAAQR